MPTKPIERLLFAQGGRCFFCNDRLSPAEASVEHLVARTNGGADNDENCVACCRALNSLLGRMSLKEKLRVVLNQQGRFRCPNGGGQRVQPEGGAKAPQSRPQDDRLTVLISDLQRRGAARPRTVKTLSNTINALFQKRLPDTEVAELLNKLQVAGAITISATNVSYHLPQSRA